MDQDHCLDTHAVVADLAGFHRLVLWVHHVPGAKAKVSTQGHGNEDGPNALWSKEWAGIVRLRQLNQISAFHEGTLSGDDRP